MTDKYEQHIAVIDIIIEHRVLSMKRIINHFKGSDREDIRTVVKDLVALGILFQSRKIRTQIFTIPDRAKTYKYALDLSDKLIGIQAKDYDDYQNERI